MSLTPDSTPAETSSAIRGTILVVEDEPPLRDLLVELLRDEGYAVREAADGQAGVDMLSGRDGGGGHKVCVVLLDMMLPRLDGVGVLRFLAGQPDRPPVVAMSASPDRLLAAAEAGADETLPKPIDFDALLSYIARYCS